MRLVFNKVEGLGACFPYNPYKLQRYTLAWYVHPILSIDFANQVLGSNGLWFKVYGLEL